MQEKPKQYCAMINNNNINGAAGITALPIGYRFHPTDQELVFLYLKPKVFAIPLPASVIPEFDVFQTHPWGLPGDLKEKRYFFSSTTRSKRISTALDNNYCKRAAGTTSGYWKPVGKSKQILASESNVREIGIRRTLIFCERKRSYGAQTRWVMHEYRLVNTETSPCSTQVSKMVMEDWAVYLVFQRKKRPEKQGVMISQLYNSTTIRRLEVRPTTMNYMGEVSSDLGPDPQPSISCKSEITEVSSIGLDQEETSTHIKFSPYSCVREL
ncbi:hypothetical protein I3760_04G002900 [Carya illinoinensis]|nr:hypothetical protein I3760_04G002900 [Carya illinoinensis]